MKHMEFLRYFPTIGFFSGIYWVFSPKVIKITFDQEKSHTQETKHISTDAKSSTDDIGGWTKNTEKPFFFLNGKKIIQNAKTQKRLKICHN